MVKPKKVVTSKEAVVSIDQGATFSKFANFFSATVNKHEVVLVLGEKNLVGEGRYTIHTKVAMSAAGAKKLVELLSSLIKASEKNGK